MSTATASLPWVLAHAGPGATWQALLVVISLGCALLVALAALGVMKVRSFDDLILPLAGVAIASSLAPLGGEWLSDWIGWAFPLGIAMLAALLLAALTSLQLTLTSPLTWGAVAVGAVAAWLQYVPLTIAWHPAPDLLPLADDSEITILSPTDGEVLDGPVVTIEVTVTGGSIGPGGVPLEQLPSDPEEAGTIAVFVDGQRVNVALDQTCTVSEPCTSVSFTLELPQGEHDLIVEFTRGDGVPLAPTVFDRVTFTTG
jgi:hypothetical protein